MKIVTFPEARGSYWKLYEQPVLTDTSNLDVDVLTSTPIGIDGIYVAPEDVEIRYKFNREMKTIKAEKGDIIALCPRVSWIKNPIFVVKNKQWKQNIAEYMIEKEKERLNNEATANVKSKFTKSTDDAPGRLAC